MGNPHMKYFKTKGTVGMELFLFLFLVVEEIGFEMHSQNGSSLKRTMYRLYL